jgi:hypothetical protein
VHEGGQVEHDVFGQAVKFGLEHGPRGFNSLHAEGLEYPCSVQVESTVCFAQGRKLGMQGQGAASGLTIKSLTQLALVVLHDDADVQLFVGVT